MTSTATGTLYALIDPRDGRARYIGQTTRPLPVRLAGHLGKPAKKVAPWFAEMAAAGVQPQITALRTGIPAAELLDAEREEITRRLLAGEPLLNESATSTARKTLRQREKEAQAARRREAWKALADNARAVLGGPMPPGELPLVTVSDDHWKRFTAIWATQARLDAMPEKGPDGHSSMEWLELYGKILDATGQWSDRLWRRFGGAWDLGSDSAAEEKLEHWVSGVAAMPTGSAYATSCFVTWMPWCVVAVAPWAALAHRAGLPLDPEPFIDWVSDDEDVRNVLTFLGACDPGVFRGMSNVGRSDDRLEPGSYLAVVSAAHSSFPIPAELHQDAQVLLSEVARQKMLTPAMADLLAELDPTALDDVFGRDVAAAADADLKLSPGTAVSVLEYLLRKGGNYGTLDRLVARAAKKLPTRAYPDYRTWHGPGVRLIQVIVSTLTSAGLLDPPEGKTVDEVVTQAQAVWHARTRWLDQCQAAPGPVADDQAGAYWDAVNKAKSTSPA